LIAAAHGARGSLHQRISLLEFLTASALSRTVTVDFPMVRDGSWRWTATESSPWLELSSASGTTPDPVELTLRADGLSDGVYETTLDLEVELGGLTTNYPIEVKMGVNEEVALPVELAAFSGSLDQDGVSPITVQNYTLSVTSQPVSP